MQEPEPLLDAVAANPDDTSAWHVLADWLLEQGAPHAILAAYDLNASTDDAYRIFRDNRIAAIGMQADPDPASGGSRFNPDEGQIRGTPAPPRLLPTGASTIGTRTSCRARHPRRRCRRASGSRCT